MDTTPLQIRMKRLFTEGFTVMDLAEPLLSFDAGTPVAEARDTMTAKEVGVIGVRVSGVVAGYAHRADLTGGTCEDHMSWLDPAQVINEVASIQDVIHVLEHHELGFVTVLGDVTAVVGREDVQKPPFRMWLFGMITIIEMNITRGLEEAYPDASWIDAMSRGRLEHALGIQAERERRGQHARLIDCLQLADKAYVLFKDAEARQEAGMESATAARKAVRMLESLRNNLAHGQDILRYDWDGIVTLAGRVERIMSRV